jgi:broad specificity phosphatase PhoE
MKTVWFIRHAQSEANAGLASKDFASISLTDLGRQQAKLLAASFERPPDLLITSPYIRTQLTAQPLLERFQIKACEEWPIHEFTCLSPVRCANTTALERTPWAEAYWQSCDPHCTDGEGAESFADLMVRNRELMTRVQQSSAEFITVFSHGQFLSALTWNMLSHWPDVTADNMARFRKFDLLFEVRNTAVCNVMLPPSGEVFFTPLSTAHLPAHLVT